MQPEIFATNEDERPIDNPIYGEEGSGQPTDPLALEIPDDELVKIVNKDLDDRRKFWGSDKYNLFERRKKLERILFGREIEEKEKRQELKKYEARYSDNVVYEIEGILKPVAMSHMPDMIVSPGNDTPESKESAKSISQAVNDDLKKRQNRRVLGLGFKHLPVYLTGVVKVRWNPELNEYGDYEFVNIHPDNILIDYSANTNNADDMRTIPEAVEHTVQQMLMRFPDKRNELFEELQSDGLVVGKEDFTWKDLATPIKYWEVWFTWYKKADTGEVNTESDMSVEEPGNKWERIEGVLWKYGNVILKKMKNPNFDYEGEEKFFTYDDPSKESSKRPLKQEEMMQSVLTGTVPPNVQKETVYHNYFQMPKKPYFFFGYDQWGKVAIDETSRIEQNSYNQENLNTQGKQIIDTVKSRDKYIWGEDSQLTSADIQGMDMDNPKMDALVAGNPNEVVNVIKAERPDQAQFQAIGTTRQNMFNLAHAAALTGTLQSDVATSNQIAREENFTSADDLVEDTINAASEWMAMWAMQFIILRYTEPHFRKLLGNKGSFTFLELKRDQVDKGMVAIIKSSGTDKLKAQNNAIQMASMPDPMIDPLTFFEDMDLSDPEGRAEKLLMYKTDLPTYIAKYIMNLPDTNSQATALLGAQGAQQAGVPPQTPPTGGPTTPPQGGLPQNPSPTNTTQTAATLPQFPQGSPRGI